MTNVALEFGSAALNRKKAPVELFYFAMEK